MSYEDFVALVKKNGIQTVSTKSILYACHPGPSGKQLLVRWGKEELLAYIDIRLNDKGRLEDICCVPMEKVTEQMVNKFVKDFKDLYADKQNDN